MMAKCSQIIKYKANKCRDLSFQLANFGKYLQEYDGRYPIYSIEHINSRRIQNSEEIRKSIIDEMIRQDYF